MNKRTNFLRIKLHRGRSSFIANYLRMSTCRATFKFFTLCLLISCLFSYSTGHTFEREKIRKNFRYSVTIASFGANEKEKYRLKIIHPYSFDLKIIRKCLVNLAYQKRIIRWSKKKRVFPTGTVKQLALLIVEQFAQADKNHRVIFKITGPSGKIKVKGDTFLTPEGIQWRLTVINYSRREVDEFSVMGESLRLVPLKGQSYKTKKPLKNVIQDITNWIIFTKFRPIVSKTVEFPKPKGPGEKDQPALRDTSDIKERLRTLEDLKREGLINEKEYKTKREDILNSL